MATASIRTVMLAHQGGWDEVLLVAGPLAVVAWLLWVADQRARRIGASGDQGLSDDASS